MRYGSVCSGIEAASVAWHPLGWEAAWLAEIEPFPSGLLAHHYPTVPNLHDMRQLPMLIAGGLVEAPDVLVGGTPCQAFSAAGLRNSLEDDRGQLSITYIHTLDAIDERRRATGRRPAIAVWENVPGVLNTHDNAFGCFLAGLAGLDEPLVVKKWPRNGLVVGGRRRVAWAVLDAQYFGVPQRRRRVFVIACDAQSVADSPALCPSKILAIGKSLRRDTPTRGGSRQSTAGAATAGFTPSSFGQYAKGCGALRSNGGDLGGGSECLVTTQYGEIAGSLTARHDSPPCSDRGMSVVCMAHGQANAEIRSDGDPPSLTCNHEVPIIAFEPGIAKREGNTGRFSEEICPTLRSGMGDNQAAVAAAMQVRRLTPEECEILQGFPVGYTNIPWRGKPTSPDGPRYKALGNSMPVPVMGYIGRQIKEALNE